MDISPSFIFPPLDKVDGVEYTYKSFINSNYKSVQCKGCHLGSYPLAKCPLAKCLDTINRK